MTLSFLLLFVRLQLSWRMKMINAIVRVLYFGNAAFHQPTDKTLQTKDEPQILTLGVGIKEMGVTDPNSIITVEVHIHLSLGVPKLEDWHLCPNKLHLLNEC